MQPLTVAQVQALIDATPERFRIAVLLDAGCGLRIWEVLGLRISAVNVTERELRLCAQLLLGQPLALQPPMSTCRVRTVPLPDTVAAAIVEHRCCWPPAGGADDLLVRSVTVQRDGR